jgi:hypothetical protein
MPTLTVPQLAEVCGPLDGKGKQLDADRLRLWIRRLRHWITLGILPSSVAQDSDDVYIAAILLRIADTGLPATLIKSLSAELHAKVGRTRTGFARIWREATGNQRPSGIFHYLIVQVSEEGTASKVSISRTDTPKAAYLGDFGPRLDTAFIVNLSEVFRILRT